MIKLKAFIISIVLVLITLVILEKTYIKKIDDYYKVEDNSIRYNTSYEKYKSYDILTQNIKPNTLVLLGSSELTATINEEYHPKKIFNYNDFNIMQIGGGYFQNIIHASILGSIDGGIHNRKVAIIQSVQWYTKEGIADEALLSRISEEHVYNTMANPKIRKETKEKFINRLIEITKSNKSLRNKYIEYKEYFVENKGTFLTNAMFKLDSRIYAMKNKFAFYKGKSKEDYPLAGEEAPRYDWSSQKERFTEEAEKNSTNNHYAIDNKYYNTYIAEKYEKLRNSSKNVDYSESPEYNDFDIFLSIAKDLGIEVEVIIFPVNGKWNDYVGVSKTMRQETYNKIERIANNYAAKVLNYGDREYEDYFLFDVMHLGARGWVNLEEELYKFSKEN